MNQFLGDLPHRWLTVVASISFFLLGAGTIWSGTPAWPLPGVWGTASILAGVLNLLYALRPTLMMLELSTAAWIAVGLGRVAGYTFSGSSAATVLSLCGVWGLGIVAAFYRFVYRR